MTAYDIKRHVHIQPDSLTGNQRPRVRQLLGSGNRPRHAEIIDPVCYWTDQRISRLHKVIEKNSDISYSVTHVHGNFRATFGDSRLRFGPLRVDCQQLVPLQVHTNSPLSIYLFIYLFKSIIYFLLFYYLYIYFFCEVTT